MRLVPEDKQAEETPNATGSESALESADLSAGYGDRQVLEQLSLSIERGSITALVGPNGSGKSTMLKALARMLHPRHGAVYLGGRDIARLPTREVARRLAILPQAPTAPEELTVAELVERGRYPHVGPLRLFSDADRSAIARALTATQMTEFRARPLDSLSGGERQRAWIALALAQETPILLLDEPTTYLDVGHQFEVLDLVRQLNIEQGMTIVLVLHDLNQAARFSHRMVVFEEGHIVADGSPGDVLTPKMLARVFNVRAHVVPHPEDGSPVCLPYGLAGVDGVENGALTGLPVSVPEAQASG
ncbi:MAG TPA: ABC transporter ATP-binding protein [Thermomicrobiaceae bacterium]|nr:ABC transporter ATP-binding protein [Thermomicrobiaceae bacterium]